MPNNKRPKYQIINGDCLDVMSTLADNCISSIVTDSPYGLNFMNRDWDHGVPGVPYWSEALRVTKPGGYLVAFGGPRTHHRLVCAIEDAGWDIRDCLFWFYVQGYPKSHNISLAIDKQAGATGHRGKALVTANHPELPGSQKNLQSPKGIDRYVPITPSAEQWDGWGTALKPAVEPICLARKPFKGTVAKNILLYGTGGLHIEACRIGDKLITTNRFVNGAKPFGGAVGEPYTVAVTQGYWPSHMIIDELVAQILEHQKMGLSAPFYCPKVSKKEREAGLYALDAKIVNDGRKKAIDNPYQRGSTKRKNTHPTVKPLKLMQWLIRLVTPPGGVVFDPYCGSGSTIAAAMIEGFDAVGVDIVEQYVEIARLRAEHWLQGGDI